MSGFASGGEHETGFGNMGRLDPFHDPSIVGRQKATPSAVWMGECPAAAI